MFHVEHFNKSYQLSWYLSGTMDIYIHLSSVEIALCLIKKLYL